MHGIQALTTIPDPRRRRGRHSSRVSLLAIVLRAAMHPPDPHPPTPFMGRFFILPLPDAVAARMEAPPMGQAFSARVQGCTAQREAYPA